MTDHDWIERVRNLMRENGIPRNSHKHRDYEWGISLLEGMEIPGWQYFLGVSVIADWAGV